MRSLLSVACAVLMIVTSIAEAQQPLRSTVAPVRGWRTAIWGMTPSQVVAAFTGEVKELAKVDEYGRERQLVAPIGIDRFDIGGITLKVRFLFPRDSQRLTQVLLSKFEDKDFVPSRSDFTHLAQLLTEKYGPPTFQDSEANKATTSWAFAETVIELSYLHIRSIVQSTTLIYRPVDAKLRSLY